MKKQQEVQVVCLLNGSNVGPLSACYDSREDLNKAIGEWGGRTQIKIKTYSRIWDAFLALEQKRTNGYYNDAFKLSVHMECTDEPCVSPRRIEFRQIKKKGPRLQNFIFPEMYNEGTSVGIVLQAFDALCLCKIQFCRYTVFADSKIQEEYVANANEFVRFIELEENRKALRIYCIAETLPDNDRNSQNMAILYTDTKIWSEIPEF